MDLTSLTQNQENKYSKPNQTKPGCYFVSVFFLGGGGFLGFFFAGGRSRVTSKESFIYCGYTCDNKHYKSLVITSPSSRDDMSFRSRWGRGRAMHNSSSPDQGVV